MDPIESAIEGSEKLVSRFGYWPTFHDAEVVHFNLWRGNIGSNPEGDWTEPELLSKIHVWEMTNEVDDKGYLVHRHNTLVTLRFSGIDQFTMDGFNHQNAIMGLSIAPSDDMSGRYQVIFAPAFGIGAEFTCSSISIVEAIPCKPNAEPST